MINKFFESKYVNAAALVWFMWWSSKHDWGLYNGVKPWAFTAMGLLVVMTLIGLKNAE